MKSEREVLENVIRMVGQYISDDKFREDWNDILKNLLLIDEILSKRELENK